MPGDVKIWFLSPLQDQIVWKNLQEGYVKDAMIFTWCEVKVGAGE